MWHTDTGEELEQELRPAVRALNGETSTGTFDIQRFDGKRGTIMVSAVPLRDQSGGIDGVVTVAQDITMLKVAEEELKRSNDELQQFAYVASHDLQEPLRMVTAYLGRLEKKHGDKLNGEAREYMHFAIDGAKRMRELINDLLAYSRVQSAGMPFTSVDMDQVLAEALSNLSTAITTDNATVRSDHLPSITADQKQMVQLLQNLIGNAIKYHGEKQPEIEVSFQDDAIQWIFSVKDNGIGIAPKHQEKIFQMFQRLHTREEYEGTGIGLTIAKRIVERHGGHIWVDSEEGNGSTFYFTIPKMMKNV